MMNQQFRGVYAGAAAAGGFGRAAVTVMGEAPAQTGFAEQVAGQSSGIADAINFLNASKGAASDLSDEVAEALQLLQGNLHLSGGLDFSSALESGIVTWNSNCVAILMRCLHRTVKREHHAE